MKRLLLVACSFGCGHTQVQKSVEGQNVVAESRGASAVTHHQTTRPSTERHNQCTDGVAFKYDVPSEPETANAIIMGFLRGDESLAAQEKRLMKIGFGGKDGQRIFCMGWDLREPKGKPDYIVCRSATVDSDNTGTIQRYPRMYIVDVDGKANGIFDQMKIFIDPDADGNVCNVVLMSGETKK